MDPRETKAETRPVALASETHAFNANTQTNASNVDSSDNRHSVPAASYSMSTLGLTPTLGPNRTDICHPGVETTGGEKRGSDAVSDTAPSKLSIFQQQHRQPYVPQFSAATSLILDRIKGDDKDFNSALSAASATIIRPDKTAFEEAKMRLMKQMNTPLSGLTTPEQSTLTQTQHQDQSPAPNLDQARHQDETSHQYQTPIALKEEERSEGPIQKGTKRKRETNEEGDKRDESVSRDLVDFSQNTIPFPFKQNQSPSTAAQAPSVDSECVKCGSSSSIPSNPLAACSRCSIVCHQACFASPPTDATSLPLCPQCDDAVRSGQPLDDAHIQPELLRRKQKIERIRQMRLAALPQGVVPAKPELVGFGPGAASDRARAEYFSNMTKTDALNLLSFCDQLRPQLLIDVLVSVSKRHPDLLMFNSPDWNASEPHSSAAGAVPSSSRAAAEEASHASRKANMSASRPPHGRSLLNSKAKQKIKPSNGGGSGSGSGVAKQQQQQVLKRPTKRVQQQHPPAGAAVQDVAAAIKQGEEDIDEDAPPPTWPKAGEGLYVKLAPEINDRLFLADENDEEAFSHFMVDKMGRQIIDPV